MARNINFVHTARKRFAAVAEKDKKKQVIAIGVLLVCVALSVGSILAHVWFRQSVTALEEREIAVREELLSQSEAEYSYAVFAQKVAVLSELFGERKNKQEAIDYFSNAFGRDVSISEIRYSSQDQFISFGLQAKDVFVLEEVYNTLSNQRSSLVRQVQKDGLRRTADGGYIMDLTVYLTTET
ncbi:MAG: hypothetical protein H6774_04410 [Pseudomonadales bacterium]|nr:hypothetical protein [Candidatus Woesebacteria bacterium]MCB9802302.1 hypothetical protein [Pseudomonadales bacterium]